MKKTPYIKFSVLKQKTLYKVFFNFLLIFHIQKQIFSVITHLNQHKTKSLKLLRVIKIDKTNIFY